MKVAELKKLLTSEDKMMIAVKYEVTYRFVEMVVAGERVPSDPQMLLDLETLACENIIWIGHKQDLIAA